MRLVPTRSGTKSGRKWYPGLAVLASFSSARKPHLINETKIRDSVTAILEAIGEDTEREGLAETPQRVAKLYSDFFSGLDQDPSKVLENGFDEGHAGLVAFDNLHFFSMCEHHLLPFIGTASVGYLPGNRIVGASKIARAVDNAACR